MVSPTTSLFSTAGFFFTGHRNLLRLLRRLTQLHKIYTWFLFLHRFAPTVIGILLNPRNNSLPLSLTGNPLTGLHRNPSFCDLCNFSQISLDVLDFPAQRRPSILMGVALVLTFEKIGDRS
ncbi:hypothetical protein U1Q18_001348 [Sarracenia purpurea var. burkii]